MRVANTTPIIVLPCESTPENVRKLLVKSSDSHSAEIKSTLEQPVSLITSITLELDGRTSRGRLGKGDIRHFRNLTTLHTEG